MNPPSRAVAGHAAFFLFISFSCLEREKYGAPWGRAGLLPFIYYAIFIIPVLCFGVACSCVGTT